MNTLKLKAETRSITGRKIKRLRDTGIVPGNLYGKKIKSLSVQVDQKDFDKIYKEVGETGIIHLSLNGNDHPVLISDVQRNVVSDKLLHIDFRQVDLKEKIEAQIPVVLIGESPAEKQSLGTVVLQLNQITVEALPMDLPEKFEVSIENLVEVDQALYVKDIKIDNDVVVKSDLEAIVVKVEPPQKEEVIEAAPVVAGESPESTTGDATNSNEIKEQSKEEVNE